MVEKWTKELNEAAERPEIVFFEEFQAANKCLEKNDYIDLKDKIKAGLTKALDIFKKWMDIWTHLPLSVCNLGGNNGQAFAQAVICVILNFPLPNSSNNLVSKYIIQLVDDFNNQRKESFGLFEALQEDDFRNEFIAFSVANDPKLFDFPLLYDFIKNRIWSIVVHQQHVEGMFNKYDLKIHANMNIDLQEARLKLSGPKPLECMLTSEKLKEVRAHQHIITPNPINLNFGEEATKDILKHILKNK
jgi:hypothetical protein